MEIILVKEVNTNQCFKQSFLFSCNKQLFHPHPHHYQCSCDQDELNLFLEGPTLASAWEYRHQIRPPKDSSYLPEIHEFKFSVPFSEEEMSDCSKMGALRGSEQAPPIGLGFAVDYHSPSKDHIWALGMERFKARPNVLISTEQCNGSHPHEHVCVQEACVSKSFFTKGGELGNMVIDDKHATNGTKFELGSCKSPSPSCKRKCGVRLSNHGEKLRGHHRFLIRRKGGLCNDTGNPSTFYESPSFRRRKCGARLRDDGEGRSKFVTSREGSSAHLMKYVTRLKSLFSLKKHHEIPRNPLFSISPDADHADEDHPTPSIGACSLASSSSSSFSSSSHKIKQIPSTFDQTLFRTASTKKKHYFKSPSRYRRKDEAQIPRVLNAGSSYIDVEDSIRGAIEHCNKSSST